MTLTTCFTDINKIVLRVADLSNRSAADYRNRSVKTIEYDPNRTANIALVCYVDGEKRYILAPVGLKVGQVIMNGPEAEIKVGNCLELKDMPVGTQIHNIEMYPGHLIPMSYTPFKITNCFSF